MKKTTFLAALLIAAGTLCASVKTIPMSYTFSPETWKGQASFADPQCKKLTDGVLQPPSRVIWNVKAYHYQPVKIGFQFGQPVQLESIRLHYQRGPKSYGLKRINLSGENADGSAQPLAGQVLKQPYALPAGMTPWAHETLDLPVDAGGSWEKINVEISAVGSYVALNEIEFFTKEAPRAKAAAPSAPAMNPWQKYATGRQNGLQLRTETQFAVMENNHVLYILDAVNGGCVNFCHDKKSGVNLLKPAMGKVYGGMFLDRFYPGSSEVRDCFLEVKYDMKVTEDSDGRKAVTFTGKGRHGIFTNVTIEKTYSLTPDSPVLQADYKVLNDQANVVPLKKGLWIAGGVANDRPYEFVYPGAYRIERAPVKVQNLFMPSAVRGWMAALDGRGSGLGLLCDYSRFKSFYAWGNNDRENTMECRLGVYDIPANDSMTTSFALVPFHHIGSPDGISRRMAGSLGLPAQCAGNKLDFTVRLHVFQPGDYELELRHARMISDKTVWKTVGRKTLTAADRYLTEQVSLTVPPGTQVVQLIARQHGRECFLMEGTSVRDRSTGLYTRCSECARRPESGQKKEPLNLNFNSMEIATPHRSWGKPWAGRKPRVLAICFHKGGIRDMIEVAQRYDMELTTSYIGGIWKISGSCTSLSESDCFNELAKQLKKPLDVIAVSSRIWQKMPAPIQETIVAKVQQGAGLILAAPENMPKELAAHFSPAPAFNHFIDSWKPARRHPVTAGIPFAALPPTRALPYATDGQVLATIGNSPLVSVFSLGKGKVAAAGWAVDGRKRNSYHMTYAAPVFLPLMLFNRPTDYHFDYWEYQISLLAKMIYHCAGISAGLDGQNLEYRNGRLNLALESAAAGQADLELDWRNARGETVRQFRRTADLKQGLNELSWVLNLKPAMDGVQLLDLRILRGGKVAWWGSASFDYQAPLTIGKVTLPRKIWQKSENIQGEVQLSTGGQVRISLWDNLGNELARSSSPRFSLPLKNCRTLTAELRIEALNEQNQITDRKNQLLTIFGAPDARRLQVIFGWPNLSQRAVQSFLLSTYYEKLIELGASAILTFRTDTAEELETARRHNLPIVGASSPVTSGGKFPFENKGKPKTKFDLIRKPCLSRPGYQDFLEKESNQVTELEKLGVLFRSGPDEANSITAWDGCFSKDCQKEFRLWLQKKYGSLEALNQSWQTQYGSWQQVLAMTSDEVRNHASFAPWVDHRTFNDENRANAIGRIVKGMKTANPAQRYSLSGTQETNACNAWDWYLLMQHLEALQSYGGEQTVQQRCFTDKKIIWQTWIGYDSAFADLKRQIHYNLMQGATGFSVYSGDFYVNPDYTLPPRALDLKKALGIYRNGPAEALISARFLSYPIALYYSPASIKVNQITGRTDLQKSSVQGFKQIWQSLGLSYDYVASEDVRRNRKLSKYRILVLPVISALSEEEIGNIGAFVKQGGILIADQFTALYDNHGKPWKTPRLAELFGLNPDGVPRSLSAAGELAGNSNGNGLSLADLKLQVKHFEQIRPGTARPLGTISCGGRTQPAVWVNSQGRGQTIYLGCSMTNTIADWKELRHTPKNQLSLNRILPLFKALCDRQNIHPLARIPGMPAADLHARCSGPARLLGISSPMQGNASGDHQKVLLDRPYHVYDMLNCKYLGHGREIIGSFPRDSQSLWALLPYKPGRPSLKLDRLGDEFRLSVSLPGIPANCADHLYKVKLLEPDGRSNPAYETIIFGRGSLADYGFALPLNRKKGTYTLTVTEVFTGQKAECEVEVNGER